MRAQVSVEQGLAARAAVGQPPAHAATASSHLEINTFSYSKQFFSLFPCIGILLRQFYGFKIEKAFLISRPTFISELPSSISSKPCWFLRDLEFVK